MRVHQLSALRSPLCWKEDGTGASRQHQGVGAHCAVLGSDVLSHRQAAPAGTQSQPFGEIAQSHEQRPAARPCTAGRLLRCRFVARRAVEGGRRVRRLQPHLPRAHDDTYPLDLDRPRVAGTPRYVRHAPEASLNAPRHCARSTSPELGPHAARVSQAHAQATHS